ncbi:MAG: MFS transporter [Candidatus Nanopelagicales bacterium]
MQAGRAPLYRLEVANALAGVANSTVAVVVPWLVLEETGSAADAGLVGAAAGIPGIFVAPFVGALVDRFGRRRVSMGSDAMSAVSVALFPLAERADLLGLGEIAVIAVIGTLFDPAGYTARKSLIPDVTAASQIPIDRVNGIHEGVFAAGWVVGPALGAIGISTVGAINTFWITAAAFVAAVLAVRGIRIAEAIAAARLAAGEEHEPFWSSTLRGAGILWRDRPLRVLTLAISVLAMVYVPTEAVLMPVHFESLGEPGAYGLTLTMLAAGSMIGSFSYGWLVDRVSRHRIAVAVMVGVTASIIPMAFLPPLPVFVTCGFLLGLTWGPMDPMLNSLVQDRVPAHVQGRVYGVQTSLFYAAPSVGLLLGGIAVERLGVQVVYAIIAGLLGVVALLVAALPSLRGLDQAHFDQGGPGVTR